jgi:hypothetical protein
MYVMIEKEREGIHEKADPFLGREGNSLSEPFFSASLALLSSRTSLSSPCVLDSDRPYQLYKGRSPCIERLRPREDAAEVWLNAQGSAGICRAICLVAALLLAAARPTHDVHHAEELQAP